VLGGSGPLVSWQCLLAIANAADTGPLRWPALALAALSSLSAVGRAARGGNVGSLGRPVAFLGALGAGLEEGRLRAAAAVDGGDPQALWELGMWLAHRGSPEGRATLERAVAVAGQRGIKMTAMAFPPEEGGLQGYQSVLGREQAEFLAFCETSPALERVPALRQALPRALEEMRQLPQDDAWLVSWAAESAQLFGPDPQAATFGETPFEAWQQVLGSSTLAAHQGTRQAVVLGSALGYQCLFFLAIGVECVGYDILPESLVQTGLAIVNQQGIADELGTALRVGDARRVDLAPVEGVPSLLWLNNEAWPRDLRAAVFQRAASELEPGSAVVSYGPASMDEDPLPPHLRLAETLRVRTSWDASEEIRIFLKAAT